MKRSRVAAGLAALALLAGACGKEDSGPTAAEYIVAADKLCLRAQERVDGLNDDFGNFDDVKRFAANAAKIGDALLTDLKALEVPEDLTEKVDEFNGEFTNGMRLIRRLGKAAEDQDANRIEELAEEVEDQDQRLEKIGEDIGYKECGISDEEDKDEEPAADEDPAEEGAAAEDVGDGTGDDTAGDPSGDDEEVAEEPPVTLDDIQTALEDKGIEFLATDDVASLEEDSDPPPVESAAFETDDGSAVFDILVYATPDDARAAKAGINAAAGCGDEGSTTVCAGVGNAILVIEGDGPTVQEIGQVFTEAMRSA